MVSPTTLTEPLPLREWAESVMHDWQQGQSPDTIECLRRRPELGGAKSVMVELAYEEYRLRRQRGEAIDAQAYCAQFSKCRYELRRMLSVHRALIEENPSWLASFEHGFAENADGLDAWPTPGQDWLGYQILEELGRGGLARVYLAAETEAAGRHVVLKLSARETDEAQHLAPLSHANIVPVLTVRRDERSGMSAIVMPFLGRTTLYDVLDATFGADSPPRDGQVFARVAKSRLQADDRPFQPATEAKTRVAPQPGARSESYVESIIRLGLELADALAHTHERGVLHRDLKPSNVLITPSGRPLLMDFNLSTSDGESALLGGTIPYMPRELLQVVAGPPQVAEVSDGDDLNDSRKRQVMSVRWGDAPSGVFRNCDVSTVRAHRTHPDPAQDQSSQANWQATADVRSDLFSLGAILCELYTGELPYGQPNLQWPLERQANWMIRRQTLRLVSFPANNSRLAKRFERILQSCLAPDPAHRPTSARHLVGQLAALLPERRTWRWRGVTAYCSLTAILVYLSLVFATIHETESNGNVTTFGGDSSSNMDMQSLSFQDLIAQAESTSDQEAEQFGRDLDKWMSSIRCVETNTALSDELTRHPSYHFINVRTGDRVSSHDIGVVWAWIAYCNNLQGRFLSAIDASRASIRHGVNVVSVHNNLSHALRCVGRHPRAVDAAQVAIDLDSSFAAPYLNRALALRELVDQNKLTSASATVNEDRLEAIRLLCSDVDRAVALNGESYEVLWYAATVHRSVYMELKLPTHMQVADSYLQAARKLRAPRASSIPVSQNCDPYDSQFEKMEMPRYGLMTQATTTLMRPSLHRDRRLAKSY